MFVQRIALKCIVSLEQWTGTLIAFDKRFGFLGSYKIIAFSNNKIIFLVALVWFCY